MHAEQHTDADACRRRPTPGLPVSIVRPTPASAKTRPTSAPVSSSSTTGSSGLREVRMNRHQLPDRFSGRDSFTAVRKL